VDSHISIRMTFWQSVRWLHNVQWLHNVRWLHNKGLIPLQWRAGDLEALLDPLFSVNTIRTVPANQSISRDGTIKGNYVLRGMEPEAYRLGGGLYELT